MRVWFRFGLAFVLATLQIVSPGFGDEPPNLSAKQRRDLKRLIDEFGRRDDREKRLRMADEILRFGHDGATQLLSAVGKELNPELNRYRESFYRVSLAIAREKIESVDLNEVARIRQDVLKLGRLGNRLTKQTIQQKGDPAIARLTELLVIDRKDVLESDEKLQMKRKELLALGEFWGKCMSELAKENADSNAVEDNETPTFEQHIQDEERLAAQLAMPMNNATRAVLKANSRLESKLDPEESRCILALNLTRNLLGLSALKIDLRLRAAAREHSSDMERLKFFDHSSPIAGKATPSDRAKKFRTSASAENIAKGARSGTRANVMWFHSPGHHSNMLKPSHRRVGAGRSGVLWTEMFGG